MRESVTTLDALARGGAEFGLFVLQFALVVREVACGLESEYKLLTLGPVMSATLCAYWPWIEGCRGAGAAATCHK